MGRVAEWNELSELSKELKSAGKKIVTSNGCFDILHLGHVRILQEAKSLGDILIVGINSDDSVKRLKGPTRPINTQADRAEVLAALGCIDYVVIFAEDTPVEFLQLVKPNIHVKGADYTPEQLAETSVVESNGGKVKILKLIPGRSTTGLVSKINSGC